MNILLYVGPAPWRDLVLQFSLPIVQNVATSLTLVTGGGNDYRSLLHDAVARLDPPAELPVQLYVSTRNPQAAILAVAKEQSFDLVILGRFHQSIARLLPGAHSKDIAQRLHPSVLRVHGLDRPIQRILLASGGDHHTFDNMRVTAQIAAPLNASVTLLHVFSQQSLVFEGFSPQELTTDAFLTSTTSAATIVREATEMLYQQHVPTSIKVRSGAILDEILAEVHNNGYELLVIGAHQVASPLDRILLEDITGDLLDLCPIPVLVVKGNGQTTV